MARYALTAVLMLMACGLAYAGEAAPRKATRFDSMQVKTERPRIWIDEGKLGWLKRKTAGKTLDEVKNLAGTSPAGKALVYVVTGDEASGREAVEAVVAAGARGYADGTAAICYDWCHALLSDAEKKTLAGMLVESGKKGIAFSRNWRSFHNGLYSSAWPLTAAAIALSGDDPFAGEALDFGKAVFEDAMVMWETLFADGECHEGWDYNRHDTLPALRLLTALKTATGRDFLANAQHFKNTSLFILYGQKPNGLVLNINDNDWPFLGWWERDMLLMVADEYKDPYAQYFLNHCKVDEFQAAGRNLWKELLWYDESAPEKPLTDLPLSRLFRGMGLVVARSGWQGDTPEKRSPDSWLAFRCGDYYGDHCHYDINSFQLYYKGEQALDSGRYDGDWNLFADELLGKSQLFNYYHRTIAHNTILVYDPDEKFSMPVVNDGGQRQLLFKDGVRNVPEDYEQGTFPSDVGVGTCDWATNPGRWETGDLLAYKATKDFVYVCGDGAAAYSSDKVKSFVRQLFFIQPDLVVVFDRVVSTKPEFKKTWLLHTLGEPTIGEGNSYFEAANQEGRLVCVPVLPAKRNLVKIGREGMEFEVGGVVYGYGPSSLVSPDELHYGEIAGKWRVEESPAVAATEDLFLNVIMLTDSTSSEVPAIRVIAEDDKSICIRVAAPNDKAATLTFDKGETPKASLTLKDGEKEIFAGTLANEIVLEEGRPE